MQDYEITLLSKPEKVIMYNLPPVSTSKGHYLDNWKEMIWEGKLNFVNILKCKYQYNRFNIFNI